MKRAKTTSYIAELLLVTTREDELFLNHCRYLGLKADECMVKLQRLLQNPGQAPDSICQAEGPAEAVPHHVG